MLHSYSLIRLYLALALRSPQSVTRQDGMQVIDLPIVKSTLGKRRGGGIAMSTERKPSRRAALVLTGLMFWIIGLVVALDQAYAVPMLRLTSGTDSVTITGDATTGVVTYSGSVGNFVLNLTGGFTYPALGSQSLPTMDLVSFNASSTAGGTLTIMFTQTDFSNPSGNPFLIGSAIGGVTQGTVSYQSYFDASNTPFGTASLLGNLGPYSGSFAGSSLDNLTATGLYSLTLVTTITHPGGGWFPQASSFNAELRVPEPGTVTLLGGVLLGIGLLCMWGKRAGKERERWVIQS
jgi:hypothetical protein